jgi:hypothetical protein
MNIIRDAEVLVRESYFRGRKDVETVGRFYPAAGRVQVKVLSLLDSRVDAIYAVDVVSREVTRL